MEGTRKIVVSNIVRLEISYNNYFLVSSPKTKLISLRVDKIAHSNNVKSFHITISKVM